MAPERRGRCRSARTITPLSSFVAFSSSWKMSSSFCCFQERRWGASNCPLAAEQKREGDKSGEKASEADGARARRRVAGSSGGRGRGSCGGRRVDKALCAGASAAHVEVLEQLLQVRDALALDGNGLSGLRLGMADLVDAAGARARG